MVALPSRGLRTNTFVISLFEGDEREVRGRGDRGEEREKAGDDGEGEKDSGREGGKEGRRKREGGKESEWEIGVRRKLMGLASFFLNFLKIIQFIQHPQKCMKKHENIKKNQNKDGSTVSSTFIQHRTEARS